MVLHEARFPTVESSKEWVLSVTHRLRKILHSQQTTLKADVLIAATSPSRAVAVAADPNPTDLPSSSGEAELAGAPLSASHNASQLSQHLAQA